MMRKITGLAATSLLFGALAVSTAAAQARGYVGFGGGVAIPTGSFGDGKKAGFVGQVIAGITGGSGVFGGRIDGQYVRLGAEGTGTGHFRIIGVHGDLVVTPGKRPAKAHPYFLGGVGFANGKASGAGDGSTKFAINFGLGLQVHLKSRMDFFTEARWVSVRTDVESSNFIPIVLGLRWGGV